MKKKKKKFPFYSKAAGGLARGRPDRAAYRRGGNVRPGDAEPINPNEPNAPAGGAVRQQFKKGGALSRVAASTSKGGLHRSLGIPEGEKIGAARIEAATHSSNPKTRRQANLAQTYAKYRK